MAIYCFSCLWLRRHLCPYESDSIQENIKLICLIFKQISGGSGYFSSEWREEIGASSGKKISFL